MAFDAAAFERDGAVLVRALLSPAEVADVQRWCADVASWPAAPHLPYTLAHETIDGVRTLCRVENFSPLHGGLAGVAERARALAGAALGAARGGATLFKEKLNIKPPGGRGYGAHYDGPSAAAAGTRARTFVTVQVAVDAQTAANGCLQLAAPRAAWPPRALVPPRDGNPDGGGRVGAIPDAVADGIDWAPAECAAGDALVFDHWAPHWSGPNRDARERRTLYFIFNAADEGDEREVYYANMAAARAAWAARAGAGGGAGEGARRDGDGDGGGDGGDGGGDGDGDGAMH